MKITAINVYQVNIPFKMTVGISQRIAKSADNIVVVIHSDRPDLKGYGEGAPRSYVTGETQNSAINGVRSLCLSEGFPWEFEKIDCLLISREVLVRRGGVDGIYHAV